MRSPSSPSPAGGASGGLVADLYELTMATSYLRRGMTAPATFSLFVRRLPPHRGFLVAAGIDDCLDFLEGFGFEQPDLDYLRDTIGLTPADLAALEGVRFTGDVWAVPEGRLVGAAEPLLEITAPLPQAQLVETALLNTMTFQTAVASKAARCRLAAGSAQLVDFAFRRTQGLETGVQVARLAALAGFDATSNLAAACRYRLPATGTMAHSYVEAFPDEEAAFRAFATDFPDRTTFLVDTYDTAEGVRRAARVILDMGLPPDSGVRLDSGDLAGLARRARVLLDGAGLPGARIFASGGLDEFRIAELVAAGAPIDGFGVGTKMGVSADAPYLDTAYKLVEIDGRPVSKLSPGKATLPGAKQVFRGPGFADTLALREEDAPTGTRPLLEPVMRRGRRLAPRPDLRTARARFEADLADLPETARAVRAPVPVPVGRSRALTGLARRMGVLDQ